MTLRSRPSLRLSLRLSLALAISTLVVACSSGPGISSGGKINVVAGENFYGDLVVDAAGDHHPAARSVSNSQTREVSAVDVSTLALLLHETAEHHDAFEKRAPKHDWWDWYAPYLDARQRGSTPEEASRAADRYMEEVRHVVAA